MFTIYCGYLPMITQNLFMFEIDETRYYYSARVSIRIFFA